MKYNKVMMDTAKLWANQSYCIRKKVGAILAKDGRIISNGYNGTVTGADNCCEDKINNKLVTKDTIVHAEINVILYAAKNGIKTNGTQLYITLSPCINCAKAIVQAGIKDVYYDTAYSDDAGIKFLQENNITIKKI